MRRALLLLLATASAALALGFGSPAAASAPVDSSDSGQDTTTTIDNSFLDTERDLDECLGAFVQLPGCGRVPEQEGDRGGALQMVTFVLLTVGMGLVFWRIAKAIRSRDAAAAQGVTPRSSAAERAPETPTDTATVTTTSVGPAGRNRTPPLR